MGLHIKGDIKYGCGARISDNHENARVEHSLPSTVHRNAKVIHVK